MTNLTNIIESAPSKKKIIIIISAILLLIILGVGGYLYWSNLKKSKTKIEDKTLEKVGSEMQKIIENSAIIETATKGALPSISANPLENKPDINPADKANPFKNIKTNPFK